MKKAVLTSILILSSLSLKAQQEVLDKNDFFENRPVTNVQSISSNILIVKNVWDPIEQAYVKDTIYSNTPLSTNLNIPSNKIVIERSTPQILKSSRICFGIGIMSNVLGGVLYYNGTILKNTTSSGMKGAQEKTAGKDLCVLGSTLFVIGGGFNLASAIERFKWEDEITKESLENKLKQENNERKIQELEKQLSSITNN